MRIRSVRLGGFLLVLALPSAALEWEVGAGAEGRWFDWREYQGGERLLMEFGPQIAGLVRAEVSSEPWFGRVETAWGGGIARYDGRLQTGPAYEADAWEETYDAHWRLGWRSGETELSVGLLQRDWRRYIEGSASVSSAEERYRWRLATVAAAVDLPQAPGWRVALELGLPVESYQKVYSRRVDDFSLEPGDGFYWRLAFPFRPDPQRTMVIEPWYQQQSMGDSRGVALTINGVPDGNVAYQPQSVRREIGLTLRWRFGGSSGE